MRTFSRGSGVLDGVIIARRRADDGTNGDDLLDGSIAFVQSTDGDYMAKTVGDMTLVRPLIRSRRTYLDAETEIGTATEFVEN